MRVGEKDECARRPAQAERASGEATVLAGPERSGRLVRGAPLPRRAGEHVNSRRCGSSDSLRRRHPSKSSSHPC
ncbi:hypothetical protein FA95DRAFT_1566585 [Auriscalpium vulgare]|uniref:Uncharacterized protein n=1 Tax=Auriscalpium vulgare TaxID=40419 RepID=A0ACB8R9G0_9AGAM|nr:hypothetical protein FA95DRAFT_1566585 [Auriscalpium vulgare]